MAYCLALDCSTAEVSHLKIKAANLKQKMLVTLESKKTFFSLLALFETCFFLACFSLKVEDCLDRAIFDAEQPRPSLLAAEDW